MRKALVNRRYELWVPDNVADWDALEGDWESERIESILATLHPGDSLWDIGAEHGWMAALFAQKLGGGNMVLVEPTLPLWRNIYRTWEANELAAPLGCWAGFCSDVDRFLHTAMTASDVMSWPIESFGPEVGALPYASLHDPQDTPVITIDHLRWFVSRPPAGITIDVEGAELLVLRGAEMTLRSFRPDVWLSFHPEMAQADYGYDWLDVEQFLAEVGYEPRLLAFDHEQHWHLRPTWR